MTITPYVNSIQSVTITIAAGATTGTATITAVSALAFMTWGGQTSNDTAGGPKNDDVSVTLTNSTTVTATRNTSTTASCTVYATVIDPTNSLVTGVQFGSVTITSSGTSATATIASVNTSLSVVIFLGNTVTGSAGLNATYPALSLTNSTTVTSVITTSPGTSVTASFCVVQFASTAIKSLQSISTIAGNGNTDTQTITGVNASNSVMLWGGQTLASSNVNKMLNYIAFGAPTGNITTSVIVTRQANITATAHYTNYTVVEFNAGILNVIPGTISIGAGVTSGTATITAVDTSVSFVNYQGFNTDQTTFNATTCLLGLQLTNSTTVTANENTAGANSTVGFSVVSFAPNSASLSGASQSVTISSSGSVKITSVVTKTTGLVSLTASASVVLAGNLSASILTGIAATSGSTVTGTVANTSNNAPLSAFASTPLIGTLSTTTSNDLLVSGAAVNVNGTLNSSIPSNTFVGSVSIGNGATLVEALSAAAVLAGASVLITATGAATTNNIILNGTANVSITGSGNPVVANAALVSTVSQLLSSSLSGVVVSVIAGNTITSITSNLTSALQNSILTASETANIGAVLFETDNSSFVGFADIGIAGATNIINVATIAASAQVILKGDFSSVTNNDNLYGAVSVIIAGNCGEIADCKISASGLVVATITASLVASSVTVGHLSGLTFFLGSILSSINVSDIQPASPNTAVNFNLLPSIASQPTTLTAIATTENIAGSVLQSSIITATN